MKLSEYDVEKREAKKNIFKKRYKTRFLMNLIVVKDLNNVIYIFSNDVNCNKGFFYAMFIL